MLNTKLSSIWLLIITSIVVAQQTPSPASNTLLTSLIPASKIPDRQIQATFTSSTSQLSKLADQSSTNSSGSQILGNTSFITIIYTITVTKTESLSILDRASTTVVPEPLTDAGPGWGYVTVPRSLIIEMNG